MAVIIHISEHTSHFGKMLIASKDGAICALFFLQQGTSKSKLMQRLEHTWAPAEIIYDNESQDLFDEWLETGSTSLTLVGTEFQRKVWNALKQIPKGETRTYQQIAFAINKPKAVRAVGTAIGKNPVSWIVPCHRVIRSNGDIGEYLWGSDLKNEILISEASER